MLSVLSSFLHCWQFSSSFMFGIWMFSNYTVSFLFRGYHLYVTSPLNGKHPTFRMSYFQMEKQTWGILLKIKELWGDWLHKWLMVNITSRAYICVRNLNFSSHFKVHRVLTVLYVTDQFDSWYHSFVHS